MSVPIIQVKNLVKKYNKAEYNAVDDISFDVAEGEFFTFLGPNGAGKTTTISMLTTTLAKTSGTITIAGFDTEKESSRVRQNVGIIFQKPSLDANLTAEENIRFHCVLYGLYTFRPSYDLMPQDYKQRVKKLSEILGLSHAEIFKPIKTFSGGMKRKLEIIRSLMHKPKVLFLDEPTVGLDPLSRNSLWEYLNQVRRDEKTTIFLTTHYLDEAEDADRICIINHGRILSLGTTQKIKQELIEEYIEIDTKDRRKLIAELLKKKYNYKGEGPFTIEARDGEIHKILKSIDTPLSQIRVHTPTLEEAYLEIIGADKKKEDALDEGA